MGFEAVYGIGAVLLLAALIFGVLQYHYRDRRTVRAVEKLFARATREMRRDRSLDDPPGSTSPGSQPKGSSQTAPADSLRRIFLLAVVPPWTRSHYCVNEMNLWLNGEFHCGYLSKVS